MEMTDNTTQHYHIPALLKPAIDGLNIKPSGIYVDCTLGGGGHTREILSHLDARSGGRLLSFDQDSQAIERALADPSLTGNPAFTAVHGNFRYLRNFLRFYGADAVDGILADLGVSFHHFDDPERGFSFRWQGPLDMRMNPQAERDAAALLAEVTPERLAEILKLYGELPQARQLARALCKARETEPIETVEQLLAVVKPMINPRREKKELAQVFQALRIEVNDEISALRELLTQALRALKPGARLAVITYHSLEDRLMKNFMRTGNLEGRQEKDFFGRSLSPMKLINSKAIVPDEEEIERNPRSRSAKLRIAEKLADTQS